MKTLSLFETQVFQGAAPGPRALLLAGIHGDEWEGISALQRLAEMLPHLGLRGTVTVVPIVNVPAFELAARCGPDGLDLARNCPGQADGTVSQQIARQISDLIESADFLVDLHTGGTIYRVWPLAGYTLHRDLEVLETQRQMARAFGLPLVWGTWGGLDGRTLSVARDARVPAIYAEYLGAGFSLQGVESYVQGCLNVLVEMGNLDQDQRKSAPAPRVVEDNRENAGHLQLNHPAPCSGFFEPLVELGQKIEAGHSLGVLWNGAQKQEIRARQSGEILTLRAVCRVAKDEMLAVILEGNYH